MDETTIILDYLWKTMKNSSDKEELVTCSCGKNHTFKIQMFFKAAQSKWKCKMSALWINPARQSQGGCKGEFSSLVSKQEALRKAVVKLFNSLSPNEKCSPHQQQQHQQKEKKKEKNQNSASTSSNNNKSASPVVHKKSWIGLSTSQGNSTGWSALPIAMKLDPFSVSTNRTLDVTATISRAQQTEDNVNTEYRLVLDGAQIASTNTGGHSHWLFRTVLLQATCDIIAGQHTLEVQYKTQRGTEIWFNDVNGSQERHFTAIIY